MKKILLLLMLSALSCNAYAQIIVFENLRFEVTSNSEETKAVAVNGFSVAPTHEGYELVIPSSITSDGITYKVESITENAFDNFPEIQKVILPEGLKYIEKGAFKNCKEIVSISFPSTLISIRSNAFGDLPQIEELKFPDSLVSIGDNCFYNCQKLKNLVLPKSLASIGNNNFDNFGFSELTLSSKLTSIGSNCFTECVNLKSLVLPENLRSIGTECFTSAKNLSYLKLNSSLERIEDLSFTECNNLTELTIPSSVKYIGAGCFSNSYELKSLTIEDSAQSLLIYNDIDNLNCAFENAGVTEMYLGRDITENREISSQHVGGPVFWEKTFRFNIFKDLKEATIGDKVKNIAVLLFKDCIKMEDLTFKGQKLNKIGEHAFENCVLIKNLVLPLEIQTIEKGAFYGCTGLESLTLPQVINKVYPYKDNEESTDLESSYGSFGKCPALKEIMYPASSAVEISANAFDQTVYDGATLFVHRYTLPSILETNPWNLFKNIRTTNFTSGIEDVVKSETEVNKPDGIWNLHGIRQSDDIDILPNGIYIIRRNGKTEKSIIVNR